MRIIDEKGRLFGKINVIDFLVIVFIVCLVPTFYFGYKILTRKSQLPEKEKEKEFIGLYVDCRIIKINPDILPFVSVGDKQQDYEGNVEAEIVELGEVKPYQYQFDIGEEEDTTFKEIDARLRLRVEVIDGRPYYRSTPMKIDSPLEFKTKEYNLIFIPCKQKEVVVVKEKWISLQVKFSGLVSEIANVIQKGDIEKDAFSKTTANLSAIITNSPSEVLILRDNQFISLSHPFNKDILASLGVLCVQKEGVYYFKNYPVKMGNNITFTTELYSITGLIVGLEIK